MEKPKMPGRTLLVWVLLISGLLAAWHLSQEATSQSTVPYSTFMSDVEQGKITKVTVVENERTLKGVEEADGRHVAARYTGIDNIGEILRARKVQVEVESGGGNGIGAALLGLLPWILILGLFFLMMRGMANGQANAAKRFAASRAKRVDDRKVKTRFTDVLGAPEVVDEVRDIVAFLKDRKKFSSTGGRMPKGVLLMGPPGTGKTLLARAVAGEAGVPFFSVSGSDFVEMFVGVGASRVRDLFEEGRKSAPCIIFIDEIDSVGRHRGGGIGGGNDEREQTLNQLLQELDGFETDSGIILMAATNRPDVLDPALLRPGRFDRRIVMPKPDLGGRKAILLHFSKKVRMADGVDLDPFAKMTYGFAGADLEDLVNESALIASRDGRDSVIADDLQRAFEKILLGPERKGVHLTEKDKLRVSRHEAGHAVMTVFSAKGEDLHKITVVPRGQALGMTMSLPHDEGLLRSEGELGEEIDILLGGRVAEKLLCGDVSTGASDDLKRATKLCRDMVARYGMDETIGPMSLASDDEPLFLGREITVKRDFSEATAAEIDLLVRKRLKNHEAHVERTLGAKMAYLKALAEALQERETLDRPDIHAILKAIAAKKD